jgi:uncharacterized membrane protein HdeD (DUF308 family)
MSKFLLGRLVLIGLGVLIMGIALTVVALQSRDRHEAREMSFIGILLSIAGAALIAMVVIVWPRRPKMKGPTSPQDGPPPPRKGQTQP